ncbi:Microcephalin [Eumeta japonica]|uniref:Microcephalin n=1 Tax=Eumeta variegata TaxID=151549 RepID=A0A4C1TDV5_EUMVA|nr:Microcephalin [Eumeta japonica]
MQVVNKNAVHYYRMSKHNLLLGSLQRNLLEAKQVRTSTSPANTPAPTAITHAAAPAPLAGVVALVEVSAASTAAALRSALRALGASVRNAWSPAVTHVVWDVGGNVAIRRKALRLNALVVSPRWVWQCATEHRRTSEDVHSVPRPSDPPSPRRMRSLLRWAEKENVPLELSSDERAGADARPQPRLRLSVSDDAEDDEPRARKRPRRRLYTPRPHDASLSRDSSTDGEPVPEAPPPSATGRRSTAAVRPVIVCTGVPMEVRKETRAAAGALGGRVARCVSARTTHVVCGDKRTLASLEGAARGCWTVDSRWPRDSIAAGRWLPPQHYVLKPTCRAHIVARALRTASAGPGGPLLDVFTETRVCVSRNAQYAAGAARLLRLCGAALVRTEDATLLVTDSVAEARAMGARDAVSSRWVFDSVSAGRARSLSRYRPRTANDEPLIEPN